MVRSLARLLGLVVIGVAVHEKFSFLIELKGFLETDSVPDVTQTPPKTTSICSIYRVFCRA